MKTTVNNLVGLIGVLAVAMFAQASLAQPQGQQSQPGQQAQPGYQQAPGADAGVSDQQLQQFVAAEEEIEGIKETYVEEMNAVESQEEAQTLQMETQQKIVTAVEGTGLSVQAYNRIVNAMQTNPEVREKVEQLR